MGLTATVLLANYQYGWDRHVWDLRMLNSNSSRISLSDVVAFEWIPPASKLAFAAKILFTLAATTIRLSAIFFYYRLVKDSGIKWFPCVLHLSVAGTVSVCLVFVALTIWLCS